MAVFDIYLPCPGTESHFLSTCIPLLKTNLKGDIQTIHVLGLRDDKLARMAYDVGAHFAMTGKELSWPSIAEAMEKNRSSAQAGMLLWFPHALLLKPWNPASSQPFRTYGHGLGCWIAPTSLSALQDWSGDVDSRVLEQYKPAGDAAKVRVKELSAGNYRNWKAQLGITGPFFLDAVVFRPGVEE